VGLATQAPIIVKLVEPHRHETTVVDVLVGALGLTGALAVMAIVLGAILGAVLFWLRRRK